MSKEYLEKNPKAKWVMHKTTKAMRAVCQRPGKRDEHGKPLYFTQQHHKEQCDVNEIIKKYDREGVITHITKMENQFGDFTGYDFQQMQEKVANANSMFEALPSKIRTEFDNNPANLIAFMENPENREKAIELGLIDKEWDPSEDGLGEHVIRDDKGEVIKDAKKTPDPKADPDPAPAKAKE